MEAPCPGEQYPMRVKEHTTLFVKSIGCKPDVVFYTVFFFFSKMVTLFWFNYFERQRTNLIGLFENTFRQ